MPTVTQEQTARRLREAYSGETIAPLQSVLDPTDAIGAYAVQEINTRLWDTQGRKIVGRKAGLTAKAVQEQLGVDQPDFGVLFDDMQVDDGGKLDPSRTLAERGEPLTAGDILLAGALGPMVALTPGDRVEAIVDGIGTCSFTFGDAK